MKLINTRDFCYTLILFVFVSTFNINVNAQIDLKNQKWIHGSEDCEKNSDELIQVVKYDENTWILRQNKCTNYEAPFMYLFLGQEKALLMDTGATKDEALFPLYNTINKIIKNWQEQHGLELELIVAHTHKHGDHYAADNQFKEKPNTTLVGLPKDKVEDFFKFKSWPNDVVDFDLGNRTLNIIPIPGHQEASIAVYDPSTEILLTGDTFYPGRLYVKNWDSFKESISRLVEFTTNHEVKYILGNHIEMSTKIGVDYPIGTTYHPDEQMLPLRVADLLVLQNALDKLGDTPKREVYNNFIIDPIN